MVKITIANMTCGGCAKGVLATLREAAPASEARVDLGRREVEVAATAATRLISALRSDGWEASVASG